MNKEVILSILEEYYINHGLDNDLQMVLDFLQEHGSLSYFYWITKEWENLLNSKSSINQNTFQSLMLKWFNDCLELKFSKI